MKRLTKEQILAIHQRCIEETGGFLGFRDEGMFDSLLMYSGASYSQGAENTEISASFCVHKGSLGNSSLFWCPISRDNGSCRFSFYGKIIVACVGGARMEQKLFTEVIPLYRLHKDNPYAIRIRIRMQDDVDPVVLRRAVDATMERYPYFCVKLQARGDDFIFAENREPVVISDSEQGVTLNSAEANNHLLSFSYHADWLVMDIFHGLTDGTGTYEVIRTLLYYYCCQRYKVTLSTAGIRLAGDKISQEEWDCPVMKAQDLPTPRRHEWSKALLPGIAANLHTESPDYVYSILLAEDAFMHFCKENGGSPGTMVSLLLSRSLAKLYPHAQESIRIVLCVNQRKALHAPLAHQSLVGGAFLEYDEQLRKLPLSEQVKAYRNMVAAQTGEKAVLSGVAHTAGLTKMLLAKKTHKERLAMMAKVDEAANRFAAANVSYVGKANFGEAEKYVKEFHAWNATIMDITLQISAVNGKFTLDFMQKFSSPVYLKAFLQELADNGIAYELQDKQIRSLPTVRAPWQEV